MEMSAVVTSLVSQLPHAAITIIALVLAIIRWRRHPLASLLFVSGAALQLLVSVAMAVTPLAMVHNGQGATAIGGVFFVLSLVGAVGWSLIIAAVFVDRPS